MSKILGSSSAFSNKVSKILQLDVESDKETTDALASLSRIVTVHSLENRRNLRSEVEKSVIKNCEEFIHAVFKVKSKLDELHTNGNHIKEELNKMKMKLNDIEEQNSNFICELNDIQGKIASLDKRENLVNEFMSKYLLTPDEEMVIKDSTIPVNELFFKSLSSVNRIHAASSEFMIESAGSRVAIDVMDYSSSLMESAVEKLYRWTLTTVRSSLDSNDIHSVMESLKIMQSQKPELFDQCLEEYSTLKRSIIARNMVKACTRSTSPQSSVINGKPIDFYSNDSVKYIRQLVSWTYESLYKEKTSLERILTLCDQDRLRSDSTVSRVISVIAEAIINPLKSRIESTVISDYNSNLTNNSSNVVSLYNIKCIIQYYTNKLNDLVNNESSFRFALEDMQHLVYKMYLNALSSHSCNLGKVIDSSIGDAATLELPPENLGPTDSLLLTVNLVQRLFAVYSTSPVKNESVNDLKEIVDILLDPLMKCIKLVGSKVSNPEHSPVFELNSLDTVSCVIEPMDLLSDAFNSLVSQMEMLIESIVTINVSFVLTHLGLTSVYDVCMNTSRVGQVISNIDGCDILSLSKCSSAIDLFLTQPDSAYFTSFTFISNPLHRDKVDKETRKRFTRIYSQIYQCVHDETSGFTKEEAQSLFPRTLEQVKALLHVQ